MMLWGDVNLAETGAGDSVSAAGRQVMWWSFHTGHNVHFLMSICIGNLLKNQFCNFVDLAFRVQCMVTIFDDS